MRFLLFVALIFTISPGQITPMQKLYKLYKAKAYKEACNYGLRNFSKYKGNSDYIMLYAFACLNADYIDRLAVPSTALRKTATERKNAAYFSTILLQKKLLYTALIDGTDIFGIRLPVTTYPLSIVFDKYSKKEYTLRQGVYYFTDDRNPDRTYHLYLERVGQNFHMVLEEYEKGKLQKTHKYW